MSGKVLLTALPISLFLLCGCAQTANNKAANDTPPAAPPAYEAVDASSPGYVALKKGDYATSTKDFKIANAKTPNNAYDELDLGASYQRQGRMDLAEPLYRRAMTHGHNLATSDTTTKLSAGHTVEEIACQNLAMGLKPVSIEGTATPCQTTLVVAVIAAPGLSTFHVTSYNTYFDFNKSTLTLEGQALITSAAKQIHDNPEHHIILLGKADEVGTDSYNMTLSRRRADTVRDALIEAGVAASKIETHWVGFRQLPVDEVAGHREHLNRVVEEKVE